MESNVCGVCGLVIQEGVDPCPACSTPIERLPEATDYAGVDNTVQIDQAPLDPIVEERGLLFLLVSPFGRVSRLAYLLGVMLVVAIYSILMLGGVSILPLDTNWGTFGTTVSLLSCVGMLALIFKRCHDFDSSGWILFAVILCGVFLVPILALNEGTRGRNRFGRPTRLRWSPLSKAMTVLLLGSGAYSTAMFTNLLVIESRYKVAFAQYQLSPSDSTQRQIKGIYDHASWGRKWCPFCKSFAVFEMYASWVYGSTLYDRQQWSDAVEWLEKSVRASERLGRAATNDQEIVIVDICSTFVNALVAAGELDRATDLRAKLADKLSNPGLVGSIDRETSLSNTGMVHLDREEYDKAQTTYSELIEIMQIRVANRPADQQLRSSLGGYFHNRGLARFNLGDLVGALADVREAIEFQTVAINVVPDLIQGSALLGQHYDLLGELHLERGDTDSALDAFEQACEVDPASVAHRWKVAWTRYDRLEFDKIVDVLSEFLSGEEEVHLEYLLAISLLYEELNARAEQVIERLRSRHRESIEGHFLYGVVKMIKRDYVDAVQSLGKAYQQKPNDPAILFNLSASLAQADRKSEAQLVMAELAAIDSKLAERIRRYLQSDAGNETLQPMFELSFGL